MARRALNLWWNAVRAEMEVGRDPIGDSFNRAGLVGCLGMVGLAALAALLLLCGSAAGRQLDYPPTPPGGWGVAELQVAAEYWGVAAPPNCGETHAVFDAELAPGLVGWATEPEEPGEDCQMRIVTGRVAGGLYWQCVTVVHEYGHWLGLGHSADTSSPMAAELNPTIYVRGCALLTGERRSSVTKITHRNFRLR